MSNGWSSRHIPSAAANSQPHFTILSSEQFIADQFAISPVLAPSIGYRGLTVTYPDVRYPSRIAVLHGDGSPTEHYDLTARKNLASYGGVDD